ncbi:glycosyltransferase [Qipengyuania qiaonensis]|uniref:Glycosyltransferase subfamily 4-like N-terminal domain-containing protein n=1 Tax=Qipengyuania qiaonensis TaxID=2867240 RepID=A0ABS7J8K9_9SPHN|nr:glycosyltransferase [Qipengyuania qiaonensis]MBX7483654.1 hypothetical protein [Qipengyuania qiaonensis]
MKIGYIVHDLHDAAVHRRTVALREAGAEVVLAGFVRGSAATSASIATDATLVLGHTEDAKLAKRAVSVLAEIAFSAKLRRHLAECDVVIARNLESLAIAGRVVGTRPLVYECLDIHRLLLGEGLPHRLVQSVEARLLRRVDLILTSSPAFAREYFAHRPYDGDIVLLENRLDTSPFGGDPGVRPAPPTPPQGRWTIGWFGMLRCRRTLRELLRLAEVYSDRVEILIAGKPSPAELPDLAERAAGYSNVTYVGPYRPGDLPDLYSRCHFAWCIDWFEEGLNSAWLLPNRLYESAAFGVVPIALEEVETGRWLRQHECGVVIDRLNDLDGFLRELTSETYSFERNRIAGLDRSAVVADRAETDALLGRFSHLKTRRS